MSSYPKTKGVFLALFLFLAALPSSNGLDAQSPSQQLPNDLTLTVRESVNWDAPPILALVDAKTLNIIPFYSDEKAVDLKALSWSPQGDLVAVLHIFGESYDHPTMICIVPISGDVQTCLEEQPPAHYDIAPFLIDYEYTLTWSTDGKKVYFMAEDTERKKRRLIEADTMTGKTLRTIYETDAYNEDGVPTIISWTPNLDYITVGVGLMQRSGVLINLLTNEALDLSQIVNSWFGGSIQDRPVQTGRVCKDFSPSGNYLTAIDDYDNRLIIFDKELNIVRNVGKSAIEIIDCPSWSSDEKTMYFLVDDGEFEWPRVVVYAFESDSLTIGAKIPATPPIVCSPDLMHIAFTEPDFGVGTYRVKVIYPDGQIQQIDSPFLRSQYPVWRPNTN